MGVLVAFFAFVLVWGIAIATAGFQVRDPEVALFGTAVTSICSGALAWVVV